MDKKVLDDTVIETETIIDIVYSTVIKITTGNEVYFLKIVPDNYYIEADILGRLKGQTVTHIIARNDQLKCFLTKSCGDKTLRQFFFDQGCADLDLMKQALTQYTDIQNATAHDLDFFLQKSVPDWRHDNFAKLYSDVIRDDYFMDIWDKDQTLRPDLIARENIVSELYRALEGYNLPDTLNHCDLHNNNIIIARGSNGITIIDWAETNLGHPVLSIEPFFRSLRKHHGMTRESQAYIVLQNHYLSSWGLPADEVRPILNILGNIYFVLCMRTVITLTGETFEKWSGDVTGALKDFCSLSSGT